MDPYVILGTPRGSSRRRVKEAFRALVHRAHPDRGGDPEAFVRLCVAYRDILDELGPDDGPDVERPVIAPAAAGAAVRPGPGAPDAAYLDWLGRIAAESSRRRPRPWWRKHPERAAPGSSA